MEDFIQKNTVKRILLIEPIGNLPFYVLPLALGYLKSNVSDFHTVKIFDCSMEGISADSSEFKEEILNFMPDIVGISASMQTYKGALLAVKTIKSINRSIITVMGGAHPSLFAEQIMQNEYVDYVFRGEAELSFPLFLDQLDDKKDFSSIKGLVFRENGNVIKNEINLESNLDKINIPDYKSLRLDEYIKRGYNYGGFYGKSAPIWITRGCPYRCAYCSAMYINGKKIRHHSIQYLVEWIDNLYKNLAIRQFAIIDDNFTFYQDLAKKFCRTIIRLRNERYFKDKIHFATPNGIRIDRIDDELLVLMKEAGWHGVSVAPESGSRKTLKRMRKNIDPDTVPEKIRRIKAAGLAVRAFFLVGYPGETEADIKKTIKLIRKCKIDALILGRFLPIPGTPVFNKLVQDGEIQSDFMPPSIFKFVMPLGKKGLETYTPRGLKNFNSFWLFFRENMFLSFRNPYSIIYFIKYYGIMHLIKKLILAIIKIK